MYMSSIFEPCSKLPIIDFFRREFGDENIFEEYEGGYKLKRKMPETDENGEWDYRGDNMHYFDTWNLLDSMAGIRRPPPCRIRETDLPGDIIVIDGKLAELLRTRTITIDPEVADQNTGVRKAYYRVRGKPVTCEQRQYTEAVMDFEWDRPSYTHLGNFSTNFFTPFNGIKSSSITQKYPHIGEYIDDALLLASRCPFIDLIIVVTGWNEIPDDEWDKLLSDDDDSERDEEEWDLEHNIDIGLYVHDGNVELLNREHAWEVYSRYDKEYGREDPAPQELTVYRTVDPDKLPAAFDGCFFPEGQYKGDDVIKSGLNFGDFFIPDYDPPAYIGKSLMGTRGRLIHAVIDKQAELLKKYFGLSSFYLNCFNSARGFRIWKERREPDRYIHTAEKRHIAVIDKDVPAFIHELNSMIREYLVWCYERRIDPYLFNVIPLAATDDILKAFFCRTQLERLTITERMKAEERAREPLEVIESAIRAAEHFYYHDSLDIGFSEPVITSAETYFESMPVVCCKLRSCIPGEEESGPVGDIAEFSFRADGTGRLCFFASAVYDTDGERVPLTESCFSLPNALGFRAFCMFPEKMLVKVLKQFFGQYGGNCRSFRIVLPRLNKNAPDPKKRYSAQKLCNIRVRNGEPDLNELPLTNRRR